MATILLVNSAEPGVTEFVKPLERIVQKRDSAAKIIEYKDCLGTNFEDFDGVILSGSPQGDDIVEHHSAWYKWIRNCTKPVLGICAGHHITGYLYGAELLRSEEPESGDFVVEIVKVDPIFKGMPKTIKVKQMHNDSITLPTGFDLLATSKTCRNQLMKHKNKPLYTCQFHPEFYNHELIRNFIEICTQGD